LVPANLTLAQLHDVPDALADPTHEQHEELQDWAEENYDPDVFSIDDVSRMLTPMRRRRRNTSRGQAPSR
jgi:hypothetical protein